MDITQILEMIQSAVNSIAMPLIGALLFYSIRKRKEEAEARKAETDNINSYADAWKELYEKKEEKVHELDTKIDTLYTQINEDRSRIRDLMEKNQQLELRNQLLEEQKCVVRGCDKRQPQSNTYN